MESSGPMISRVVSHDVDVDANYAMIDRSGNGVFTATESARPIDISERGDEQQQQHRVRKIISNSSCVDGDSHARATTVSQIDNKGLSINTMRQNTYDDSAFYQNRPSNNSRQLGMGDVMNQEYYVLKRRKERRMSSLSMGSAKPSRRERYLSIEEQYEMLKLHHLNLLNEIHETALMLNLFEQRQLLREQQQLKIQRQQAQYIQFHNLPRNDTEVDTSESEHNNNMNNNWGVSHISDDDDDNEGDEQQQQEQDPLIGHIASNNSDYVPTIKRSSKRQKVGMDEQKNVK